MSLTHTHTHTHCLSPFFLSFFSSNPLSLWPFFLIFAPSSTLLPFSLSSLPFSFSISYLSVHSFSPSFHPPLFSLLLCSPSPLTLWPVPRASVSMGTHLSLWEHPSGGALDSDNREARETDADSDTSPGRSSATATDWASELTTRGEGGVWVCVRVCVCVCV